MSESEGYVFDRVLPFNLFPGDNEVEDSVVERDDEVDDSVAERDDRQLDDALVEDGGAQELTDDYVEMDYTINGNGDVHIHMHKGNNGDVYFNEKIEDDATDTLTDVATEFGKTIIRSSFGC